jgi:hypothetical protein
VLTLALSRSWPIHQLDVKNAFLHGTLTETVYCQQPSGFVDPFFPEHVCRLNHCGTTGLPVRRSPGTQPHTHITGKQLTPENVPSQTLVFMTTP